MPDANFQNETVMYLVEYNRRNALKEMGFTDSMENLDALTGELFFVIGDEISKLEKEKQKAESAKGRKR